MRDSTDFGCTKAIDGAVHLRLFLLDGRMPVPLRLDTKPIEMSMSAECVSSAR